MWHETLELPETRLGLIEYDTPPLDDAWCQVHVIITIRKLIKLLHIFVDRVLKLSDKLQR